MSDVLSLYQAFVRAVEAGSFTAVARELNTTQPTISRQVALLEEHLGCRLLQRTTRALSLTDDGRVFYDLARRTLEAAGEAENSVGRRKRAPSGRLRLACAGVFGRLHVIPRLPQFMARYPEIVIDLLMSDGYSDLVEEGIDLAIRVGEIGDANLIARTIGTSRRVVVAAPEYLAKHGTPERPEDLRNHRCIVYDRAGTNSEWQFTSRGGLVRVPISGSFRVNNTEGVREAVLNGLGIGNVPQWHFIGEEIESGRVISVLRNFEPPAGPISAVYPSRRFLAPKVRAAIDFLADEFKRDPKLAT